MAIDFYGRFEAETSRDARTGQERMHYFNPPGGTSTGVDPIGLLRGAPHRELARAFMEFVLSLNGQKIWDFKVGAPGGPQKYALRRLPIRRELYAPEFAPDRADPDAFPYEEAKNFTYHPEWTSALFVPLRFVVRVMCVAPARGGARGARGPDRRPLSTGGRPHLRGRFQRLLRGHQQPDSGSAAHRRQAGGDPVGRAEYAAHFRTQYQRAVELARAGR